MHDRTAMLKLLRSIDSTKQKKMPIGNRSILLTDTQRLWYLSTQRNCTLFVINAWHVHCQNYLLGDICIRVVTTGPANNIYKVSQFLEISSMAISVRRSKTRAEMWDFALQEPVQRRRYIDEFIKIKPTAKDSSYQTAKKALSRGLRRCTRTGRAGGKSAAVLRVIRDLISSAQTPEWSKNKEEDILWMLD